jgi:hypothetical protein
MSRKRNFFIQDPEIALIGAVAAIAAFAIFVFEFGWPRWTQSAAKAPPASLVCPQEKTCQTEKP